MILTTAGMVREEQDALVAGLCAPVADVAALNPRERALVAYADILTLKPRGVRAEHINALRGAGCDDRAIHDACAIVGYFAFVNRIADGLGVEIEVTTGSGSG